MFRCIGVYKINRFLQGIGDDNPAIGGKIGSDKVLTLLWQLFELPLNDWDNSLY